MASRPVLVLTRDRPPGGTGRYLPSFAIGCAEAAAGLCRRGVGRESLEAGRPSRLQQIGQPTRIGTRYAWLPWAGPPLQASVLAPPSRVSSGTEGCFCSDLNLH